MICLLFGHRWREWPKDPSHAWFGRCERCFRFKRDLLSPRSI